MRRLAAAAVVLLIPTLAWAGGEEFPDNGAQALSRGGAFTAKADDLTALEYNVAGLAWVRGTRLQLSANIVNASASFQRLGTYPAHGNAFDNQPYPEVSNSGGPFFAPMIMAASDFGTKKWTFGLGVYGPSAYGTMKFPSTVTTADGVQAPAPQRYDLIDDDLLVAYPTFAVAWRPLDFISIGAEFHWVYMSSKFHETTYLGAAQAGAEDPYYDYDIRLDVSDAFSASYSIGALARPLENLMVGVNYRAATDIDASGSAVATTSPADPARPKPTVTYDNGQSAQVDHFQTGLPQVIRAGVRYLFKQGDFEKGDLEADFVYEGWHDKLQNIQIRSSHVTPQPSLILSPHRYDDTYSVRLGGQYNYDSLAGLWAFRAGLFYDTAAAPTGYTRLDFMAWDHTGFTAGVGWQMGGLSLNLGGAYILMLDRTVSASEAQINPTPTLGGPSMGPAINAGTFSAGYTILTLSAEYRFDPFR